MFISTHTLTWSVTLDWKNCGHTVADFNSHAHVERDRIGNGLRYILEHFNSHAHVERDLKSSFRTGLRKISTHTLTWSVTGS